MLKASEKLASFIKTITEESSFEINRIQEKLVEERAIELERYKEVLAGEIERYKAACQADIRARESRRIDTVMTGNKQALLQYRESCAMGVFREVRARLAVFTRSPRYLGHLKSLLRDSADRVGRADKALVYLRREDMPLAAELGEVNVGFPLEFREGTFNHGGLRFICESRRMSIDLSFDTALEDMYGHFAEMSGMRIE